MIDPIEIGKAMGGIVREAVAPLLKRIEELEARQLERGEKGENGVDGKDGLSITLDDVSPMINDVIAKAMAEITPIPGKDGERGPQGQPGKDADPVAVSDIVSELLVAPELKTLVDLHVAEAVTSYFQENPVQHGKDAEPVSDDQISKHVASYLADNPPVPGKDGADGVGLAGAVINRSGELVVTKSNGESIALGVVIGKDGDKGLDGKDGADFSDVELDYDGERSLIIRGKGGELVKRLPIPIDRGYWREGMKSEKGDVVTQEGSAWIALKDTNTKPCRENADDWRMMARKGRDGAPGPAGKEYRPPEPVKLNG